MPELPEVETIARQLHKVLPGRVIQSIEVRRDKSFKGLTDQLLGRKIKSVTRKAKNIIVRFEDGRNLLLIHLKMTGQLVWRGEALEAVFGGHPTPDWVNGLPSTHTRIVCHFEDGSILYFNDMRVFGWWKAVSSEQWAEVRQKLPPDVVDPEYTEKYLKTVLKSSSRAVKLVLLDQAKIGGLGNIYVNDALWLAGTKPTRSSRDIKPAEVKRIYEASVRVIHRGIETGGASESTYKHINGLGGTYQNEFLIYKRNGQKCRKNGCHEIIRKMSLGGRGTYWCSGCQK